MYLMDSYHLHLHLHLLHKILKHLHIGVEPRPRCQSGFGAVYSVDLFATKPRLNREYCGSYILFFLSLSTRKESSLGSMRLTALLLGTYRMYTF